MRFSWLAPSLRNYGAGDEDRTGNFQLGKLNAPPCNYNKLQNRSARLTLPILQCLPFLPVLQLLVGQWWDNSARGSCERGRRWSAAEGPSYHRRAAVATIAGFTDLIERVSSLHRLRFFSSSHNEGIPAGFGPGRHLCTAAVYREILNRRFAASEPVIGAPEAA